MILYLFYLNFFLKNYFFALLVPLHNIWLHFSGEVYQLPYGCASVISDKSRACTNVIFNDFNARYIKFNKKLP